jgi:vacuolar-type H+-ATPase subunit C/Vma6
LAGSTNQGYIAARFYGMRSRLLKTDDYRRLLSFTDINSFITDLRNLPTYKNVLEDRLLLEDPLSAIDSAINIVLSDRIKKILRFTGGAYHDGFKLLSLRWEMSNVQLAIRGILKKVKYQPPFIPLGDLNLSELSYLSDISDLDEALSYLESILSPLAFVVRLLISQNIPPTDLDAIDGVFNQSYQLLINKRLKDLKNRKISKIMKKMITEEREFENTKSILNFIGKLSRGKTFAPPEFSSLIFPGKARIKPEEIEKAVRNKDVRALQNILLRTSYQEIIKQMIEVTGVSSELLIYVEEVERHFFQSQIRKRFKRHSFNLGLAYFWQMTIEARNLRVLAHGIENFTREEVERRLFFA